MPIARMISGGLGYSFEQAARDNATAQTGYTTAQKGYDTLATTYPNIRGKCVPVLVLSPATVVFRAVEYASVMPISQKVTATSSSTTPAVANFFGKAADTAIQYVTTAARGWLTGTVTNNVIELKVNTTALPVGEHQATVRISPEAGGTCDNGACALIAVTYSITKRPDGPREYCPNLATMRTNLVTLVNSNCQLLSMDPTARDNIKKLIRDADVAFNAMCNATVMRELYPDMTDAQINDPKYYSTIALNGLRGLHGLGYLGANPEGGTSYSDISTRYGAAVDAVNALQARYPNITGSCKPPVTDSSKTNIAWPFWLIGIGLTTAIIIRTSQKRGV